MEVFLIRLLQFMLAIGLLVLLHEAGHFFFAKLFGVRVDKFYLFFDPSIWKWKGSIFKYKPKNSDTQYGIGWLPLGGYCKIAGMIDESFDTEQMKQPEQPWEFRAKPAWQRLLIMIGGVLVNFLLALFIYSMILFYWGDTYVPVGDINMKFNEEAKSYGFRDGDVLVAADGKLFKDFSADLYRMLSEARDVEIVRNGKHEHVSLPGDLNLLNMLKSEPRFVEPFLPADVDSVLSGTPAESIGLEAGDKILSLNGRPIDSYNTFRYEIERLADLLAVAKTHEDSMKVRTVTLTFKGTQRDTLASAQTINGTEVPSQVAVAQYGAITKQVVLTEELKLGFMPRQLTSLYKPYTREYGFFEIGSLFPPMWDWYMFWKMTAFLSIILAFMNILPIPALDGGHVLFLLYEIITRRKPSEQFMIRAEYVGFGILILLMVVANLNDILRWLGFM